MDEAKINFIVRRGRDLVGLKVTSNRGFRQGSERSRIDACSRGASHLPY